jgi:hypothetical protein
MHAAVRDLVCRNNVDALVVRAVDDEEVDFSGVAPDLGPAGV